MQGTHFLLHEYLTNLSGRHFMFTSCADLPLVINTCGWIKGIGADVLNEVYHSINCSHVVFVKPRSSCDD